jgi:two-component system, OmpR family, response regulator BaeR
MSVSSLPDMNSEGHILIVEDEPKIARVLADYLSAAGFRSSRLSNGLEVSAFVRQHSPSLVLLDLMLPGKTGLEVCRDLRAFTDVPIVMVTALVEEIDRLLGLELWADDYVCKPFSPREVVARVKAVLRRPRAAPASGPDDDGARSIGPFSLEEPRMRITFHGQRLELTTSEFRLLRRFLLSPGRVYSRAQLLTELHGTDDEAFDRAIDTHVKNLRKKLARVAPETNVLRSIYGVGYQLELE